MYIQLIDRSDRLGSNIMNYLAQIIYAVERKLYIRYDKLRLNYSDSIFVIAIFQYIDIYNTSLPVEDFSQGVDLSTARDQWGNTDFCYTMCRTVNCIKQDLISYVHEKTPIRTFFRELSLAKNYTIPFDPNRTILVHLRLEDVKDRSDYNGNICASYYRERIIHNKDCFDNAPQKAHNMTINMQAPLGQDKLQKQINIAKASYPNHTVKLISAPNSQTSLPYPLLASADPNYDLYLLSICDVVILSRSTYAFSAALFGNHAAIYMPMWGHFVCCGLDTQYDKKRYHYFY
jgi:hypothetical protein